MKNKKWYVVVIVVILLLLVTNATTFIVANGISIALGDKIIVKTEDTATTEYIKKLLYLKDEIQTSYYKDVKDQSLLDGAIKGMFEAVGDPYTAYYDADQFQAYMEQVQGSYVGIGVVVGLNEDNKVTVVSAIDGSPGKKAGLLSGDLIVKVNGDDVTGLNLEQVVSKIKGDAGTSVVLEIEREGSAKLIEKEITREEIVLNSVDSMLLEDNIGYITITQFETNTAKEFKEHLDKLQSANIKGLILDVRDNPGGMMDTVVQIVDQLIGESVIVYTEDKAGKKEIMSSEEKSKIDLPMVVLINEGSASASEIFAGALQDTGAATVVGATSFGKGIVQRMSDLNDGTGYKITVSEYFTPNGRNIHGKGIEPDVPVEMSQKARYEGDFDIKDDVQLNKAIEIMREKIK
ncbi:carboxyl-terminal processing protease [Alkalibaculum bacchi]|uniref:Carboxyl-terminal processing protease n=1 Tax=Alkalibaculum bacchi TaxID=645887 RepID=A0A366IF43_9FIRM|nr:S41 family peptidase [Alkalibaculum bacchi]RBP69062.1 carboxyl-terminal processing protease [Alkalibaculum bacchi]